MNILIDFVGRHWLHIALLVGIVVAWIEHRRFCRERREGKWGFGK